MNSKTFDQIIKINKDFYNKVAEDFDKTRQRPWKGWETILEYLNKNYSDKKISLLDLGCGNGRFLKYLDEHFIGEYEYLGLDTSDYLLEKAKSLKVKGKTKFKNHDVITKLDEISGKYNVIVAFGLTHHIPNDYFEKWIGEVKKLKKENGIIVLSFWVLDDISLSKKINKKGDSTQTNGSILDWKNQPVERYYFGYEMNNLKLRIANNKFNINMYYEDCNYYFLIKRFDNICA